MTPLLQGFRRMINEGCLVNGGLNKHGCKVVMAGAPVSKVVIDFDKPGSPLETDKTRCDYLLVAEGDHACDWVAVLELKRGRLHGDHVVRQLQAGASAAEKLIPSDAAFRFRPIAVSGSASKHERAKLKNRSNMIVLRGNKEPVRMMSCGAPLVQALRRPHGRS